MEKVSERMEKASVEELLCDASMRGDLESVHEIIAQDNYILDKVLVGSFKGKNPLHVATSTGKAEVVLALLEAEPKLAEVLDAELGTALHIASANGDLRIVTALVELSPEMCMARDRDGYNPLHIAAMKGKVDVLEKLAQTCPRAAQVIANEGNTILHLCVNYNQLESLQQLLKIIRDPKFVQSKDANGNTILHIAVFNKQSEIVEHILRRTKIKVNATNQAGWTAMDIYFFVQNCQYGEELDVRIKKLLSAAGAKGKKQILKFTWSPRVKNLMQTLMVVASLFATMAFQVGVNPPGGVWQEDTKEHQAGKAILAYKYPISYSCFMYFNTVGFLLCLALILWLLMVSGYRPRRAWGWILPVMSVLAIMTTALAYTYSIIVVSPKQTMAVTKTILVSVIVWAFVMLTYAVATMSAFELARPKNARKRISKLNSSTLNATNSLSSMESQKDSVDLPLDAADRT